MRTGFVAAMDARIREGCGEDADAMIQATPLDQLHMGLARWRKKFGGGRPRTAPPGHPPS